MPLSGQSATDGVAEYNAVHAEALRQFRSRIVLLGTKDMCLCGLLSLPRSVQLICAIEVFFSVILLIQSPDLLRTDGRYFYFLGLFDGKGWWFFTMHLTVCISCILTSILLSVGIRLHNSLLLIPHLLWQVLFVCFCIASITVMITLGIDGKMLLPSSVVLSVLLFIPGLFEVWWSFLTYQLFKQLYVFGSTFKEDRREQSSDDLQYYSTEI
ncbi:unnamed protein product, partial [Mesorhabditis belari]|uniref:Transmembrane protein n=1 Tax=Mesorhabditis belari TaxID=2138241 RepID=A0AAF3F844_9BILA